MDLSRLKQRSEYAWEVEPFGGMKVPAIIYGSEQLILDMDDNVYEQAVNVATLPGIVKASYAMPDAHWGYGFPIGGVAGFDPDEGVVSAGGVGFDISCGVRSLLTSLHLDDIEQVKKELVDELYTHVPAGLGSTGSIRLRSREMDDMLAGGAKWAVNKGYGTHDDLNFMEEHGCMSGADPSQVSDKAKKRQQDEMGTLGAGNHYLEIQQVAQIFNEKIATAFGIRKGEVVVSIHCGSRGLGHQIGTDFLKEMTVSASKHGLSFPDRELACAPINSSVGQSYLGAMRAGINCALANRQIITQLVRNAFAGILPQADLQLLYDVSHNTCKLETHVVDGQDRPLFVHRKGATRAFGPGHPDIPNVYKDVGQPVLIGGSMGTSSYILAGTSEGEEKSFNSACHGAGRAMSRYAAMKRWKGRQVVDELASQGILIRSANWRGVSEEAPGAYKDVKAVIDAADHAGLAHKVARLEPLACVKG